MLYCSKVTRRLEHRMSITRPLLFSDLGPAMSLWFYSLTAVLGSPIPSTPHLRSPCSFSFFLQCPFLTTSTDTSLAECGRLQSGAPPQKHRHLPVSKVACPGASPVPSIINQLVCARHSSVFTKPDQILSIIQKM